MSDDPNAAAPAAGDDKVLPADAGGKPGDIGGKPLADLAGDGDGTAGAATWPEDWRERLAGDDESALRSLKRYGGVDGLWKKIVNQEKIIGSRATLSLPEDATPEEIASYRKTAGIPDAPEGYGLTFPAEMKPTEADTTILAGFQKFMHDHHGRPADVKAAFAWYQQRVGEIREGQTAALKDAEVNTLRELRVEYPGRELKRNLAIADEFMEGHGIGHLLDATLPNGLPVRMDAASLKAIITAARSYADEDALYSGDGDGGGKSLDDQIAELRQKSVAGTITKAEDAKLDQLYEARVSRDERAGRRAA